MGMPKRKRFFLGMILWLHSKLKHGIEAHHSNTYLLVKIFQLNDGSKVIKSLQSREKSTEGALPEKVNPPNIELRSAIYEWSPETSYSLKCLMAQQLKPASEQPLYYLTTGFVCIALQRYCYSPASASWLEVESPSRWQELSSCMESKNVLILNNQRNSNVIVMKTFVDVISSLML